MKIVNDKVSQIIQKAFDGAMNLLQNDPFVILQSKNHKANKLHQDSDFKTKIGNINCEICFKSFDSIHKERQYRWGMIKLLRTDFFNILLNDSFKRTLDVKKIYSNDNFKTIYIV
jgi:hypothetical protein